MEENVITWLFEQDTFVPAAKLAANGECFSIISDYLGTPLQAYDKEGNKVWEQELDIYGRQRKRPSAFIPFKYQGQYEDAETGLYYNRFRYYDPNAGSYISQDPIGLAGNNPTLYAFVENPNILVDIFGFTGTYIFTDGTTSYISKGPKNRMNTSMRQRIGGTDKAIASKHVDFGDNDMGFMVEYKLMEEYGAKESSSFANSEKINSPGKKKYEKASDEVKAKVDSEAAKIKKDFEDQKVKVKKNSH